MYVCVCTCVRVRGYVCVLRQVNRMYTIVFMYVLVSEVLK